MAQEGEDNRVWERWRGEMRQVLRQVQELVIDNAIFQQSMEAISSEHAGRSRLVYNWILYIYGRDAIVAIRRILDDTGNTVSLKRLIQDIRRTPHVLSCSRFAAEYSKDKPDDRAAWNETGLRVFSRLTGSEWKTLGEPRLDVDHMPRRALLNDLKRLAQAWARVQQLANKRILHYAPEIQIELNPTWSDIHNIIITIEEVCIRYAFLLLQDDQRSGLLPANWEEFERQFAEFWRPSPHR